MKRILALVAVFLCSSAMADGAIPPDNIKLMTCLGMQASIPQNQQIAPLTAEECVAVRRAQGVPDDAEPKIGRPKAIEDQRKAEEPISGLSTEQKELLMCTGHEDRIVRVDMIPMPSPSQCMPLRKAQGYPDRPENGFSKTDMVCRYQAYQIERAYFLFQNGSSREEIDNDLFEKSDSLDSRMWTVHLIDEIFKDPRSIYVNTQISLRPYFENCRREPEKYIWDKRLI